jgi:hypothetical protein
VLRVAHTARSLVFLAFGAGAVLAVGVLFATWQALTGRIEADQLQRLSDTGQAASAILSAIALMGIAGSLYFQMQQTRAAQVAAARGMRVQLLQFAIESPQFLHVWGADPKRPIRDRQETAYISMVLAYNKTSYMLGLLTDYELREYCQLIFTHKSFRDFWHGARLTYLNDHFRDSRRFAGIVDAVYQSSLHEQPSSGGPLTVDSGPPGQVWKSGVVAASVFAVGVAVGAVLTRRPTGRTPPASPPR